MHVLGTSTFHVGQSGIPVVAWFGVLASATVKIVVEITAMGPAVIRIVAALLGTGRVLALRVRTRLWRRWGLGLCCEGLCNGLLDNCCDVVRRSDYTGVGDDAWE